MKMFFIGLIFLISPFFSFAHNPLAAKYHLEAGENASLLTVNLSQDGLNLLLSKLYSQDELAAMTEQEYKTIIVDYIKSNFDLKIGNQDIKLDKGGIKLGSHQTDLKFVLPPVTHGANQFSISIPAFKENGKQQTIFSYNVLGVSNHVVLSERNNYRADIIPTQKSASRTKYWMYFIGIGLLILTLIMLRLRKRKQRTVQLAS